MIVMESTRLKDNKRGCTPRPGRLFSADKTCGEFPHELRRYLLEYMEYMGWVILNPTKQDFEKLLNEEKTS